MNMQSSRQIVAAKQRLPRNARSLTIVKSSITEMTAASRRFLSETLFLKPEHAVRGLVQAGIAPRSFNLGPLHIEEGQQIYLIASKFDRRFYVLCQQAGKLVCSASDKAVAERCVRQMIGFIDQAA